MTDEQIARKMGIAYSTLRVWKEKYAAVSAALKKGKEIVDIEVENSLLKKAKGYTETIKKPVKVKRIVYKDGKKEKEWEEVIEAEETIHVPADTTAQIFWLKNRRPEIWRDKPIKENTDDMEKMLKNIQTMTDIIRKPVPNREIEDYE